MQITSNEKILGVLEENGVLNDTIKELFLHDVKIKLGRKYRIDKMKPVQDGVDWVVSKLIPVEKGADFLIVDLDRDRKK